MQYQNDQNHQKPSPILKINLLEAIAAIVVITVFVAGFHAILPFAGYAIYVVIGAALAYVGLLGYHTFQHRQKLAQIDLDRQQALANREHIINAQERAKALSLIEPGPDGNYPVYIAPDGRVVTFQPGNMQQPVPQSIHYAPTYHYDYRLSGAKPDEVPALPEPGRRVVTEVPTFRQLLLSGRIGPHMPTFLIGFDEQGQEVRASAGDIRTFIILGDSNMGKTATGLALIGQYALMGARIVIIDRHKNDPQSLAYQLEPLRACFLLDPAQKDAEIENAVAFAGERLRARLEGREEKAYPVLFLADEMTQMVAQRGRKDAFEELILTLESYAEEGRKVLCYGGGIAHSAKANRSGSEFLQACATYAIHHINQRQAHLALDLVTSDEESPLIDESIRLDPGQVLLKLHGRALLKVRIPYATREDMELIALALREMASQAGGIGFQQRFPDVFQAVSERFPEQLAIPERKAMPTISDMLHTVVEADREGREPPDLDKLLPKLSPDLLELVPRARQLQALGTLNSSDITQRLWNLPAKGGRNWQTYVAKYDQITRYIAMVDAYTSLFFPPDTNEEEAQAGSEAES
jgi:hypothetical protein